MAHNNETASKKTSRKVAGIARGKWSYNEKEYLVKALEFYDEVFYINPFFVTYRFERESGAIVIEYNGRVLNDLSILYAFGYADETLLLVKSLMMIGCTISDTYHTLSRDGLGKISASLDFLRKRSGTTTHVLTSYARAQAYFSRLDKSHFPLLNKPFKGNKGRGIVALENTREALKFARTHFERGRQFLVLEKQICYTREWRVYVVDGELLEAYERQKVAGKIIANLHQGGGSVAVDAALKQDLFRFVKAHMPRGYETGIYGVDLAATGEGDYHFIEINRTPGFRGFKEVCGGSLPRAVHERLVKRARDVTVAPPADYVMTFLGETSFGESYQLANEKKGKENILKTRGYDYCIEKFKDIIAHSDYTIANLEVSLTSLRESPLHGSKPFIDWGNPVETPKLLKRVGVHAVSLGNNHNMDFGPKGLEETLQALTKFDIATFGAGLNAVEASAPLHHYVKLGNDTLHIIVAAGFEFRASHIAWNYYANHRDDDRTGINLWTKSNARQQLRQLRTKYPDAFIIAYPDWGSNYEFKVERQDRLAEALFNGGADLIIGHGSHVLSEVERRDGKWILYGMGNFIYNSIGRFKQMSKEGFGVVVQLHIYRDKTMWLRLYPTFTDNRITNYQSRFVDKNEFDKIVAFLMPLREEAQTSMEKYFSVSKDLYGYYLSARVR